MMILILTLELCSARRELKTIDVKCSIIHTVQYPCYVLYYVQIASKHLDIYCENTAQLEKEVGRKKHTESESEIRGSVVSYYREKASFGA